MFKQKTSELSNSSYFLGWFSYIFIWEFFTWIVFETRFSPNFGKLYSSICKCIVRLLISVVSWISLVGELLTWWSCWEHSYVSWYAKGFVLRFFSVGGGGFCLFLAKIRKRRFCVGTKKEAMADRDSWREKMAPIVAIPLLPSPAHWFWAWCMKRRRWSYHILGRCPVPRSGGAFAEKLPAAGWLPGTLMRRL